MPALARKLLLRRDRVSARLLILAAAFAALAACGDKKQQAAASAKCYETSRQCIKVCDDTEQNAAAASLGCSDTCNGSYKAAVAICADMTPDKRAECMNKAGEDFGGCLRGCQDSFDKARKDALGCRNTCVDQLERCTSGK
jgi:hypothetical protein